MRFPLISFPTIVIGIESDSGSCVSGASGFDPAWLTDVLLVDVERIGVEDVDVFGNTELTVLVTFWTIDWTGLVVGVVVVGFGAGAVVGVVVGAGVVVGVVGADGAVAAPAGMKPATDPVASTSPDVTTPAAAKRRFRLIFSRSFSGVGGTHTGPALSPPRRVPYPWQRKTRHESHEFLKNFGYIRGEIGTVQRHCNLRSEHAERRRRYRVNSSLVGC
jgi:hypothetical protein